MIAMQKDAVAAVAPKNVPVYAMSATAHQGLTEVLRALRKEVVAARAVQQEAVETEDESVPTIRLSGEALSKHWEVVHDEVENIYRVSGEKIEKFARRTDYDNFESVNRLRDIMKKMGINHELIRAGAQGDSLIRIGESEFPLLEQR